MLDEEIPQEIIDAFKPVAILYIQAGIIGTAIPPEVEAKFWDMNWENTGPFKPLGDYLLRLATGPASETVAALENPPADLPRPLPQLFAQLRELPYVQIWR